MEMMNHPAFQRAVERLANYKCIQAIKAGKLRVVQPEFSNPSVPQRFTPRMDLVDDTSTNTIIAVFEIPGIKTSDITLQIRAGNLVVMGERRAPPAVQKAISMMQQRTLPRNPVSAADSVSAGEMEDEDSSEHSHTVPRTSLALHELRFGQFHRAIPVPEGTKESDITAALQDGMLTVSWPKFPNGAPVQNVTPPVSPGHPAAAMQ